MTGITKIQIKESPIELKTIMNRQVLAHKKDKVRALYLLKSGKLLQITEIADLLCLHRSTVHRWFNQYLQGGIPSLLSTDILHQYIKT